MHCDYKWYDEYTDVGLVSIPYGFSNALRHTFFSTLAGLWLEFQSLMGFPMHCDYVVIDQEGKKVSGFNPLWVFQCTATFTGSVGGSVGGDVSIPYGFSNALRQSFNQEATACQKSFQSLMGFPMHCDKRAKFLIVQLLLLFQSLMGFPMHCDFPHHIIQTNHGKFQSLMGFPMHCDRVRQSEQKSSTRVSIPYGFSNALRRC